ncbi:MAG TPA: zinc-ribbon domain-containing protein, partial [Candidatus Binataceae bacterium]|nr:zinc-ribbon domain-containing protein [Candidatus Binataceae bacterium]
MIQCPECGEQAPDGAKFCDRCGRSLQQPLAAAGGPVTRPLALEPGTTLDHGFEIVALLVQTSIENRYRARRTGNGSRETVILRERRADGQSDEPADAVAEPVVEPRPAPPAEDPNGPRAKTAELKRLPAMEAAPAESSELAEAAAEPATAIEEPAAVSSNGTAPPADDAIAETRQSEATYSDEPATGEPLETTAAEDLGEVFGRVLALSQTLNHPAFQRAAAGFAEGGRVYLAYPDEELVSVTGGVSRLAEPEAISAAIQVCQAISYAHRRGLRVNDICPQSVGRGTDGRIKLAGLEYVSNDNERQAEPIFNDGYTAPEIYRGRKVDKRADIFSVGALLYTWLTGERIEVESWREEAGPVTFYPPHVVSPELEQAVRRALLFDPAARWANIDELKTALIRLLAEVAVEASVLTDVGMVREHNEDSVMALEYTRDSLVEPARSFLYAVCDGMGGAEAGEVASAIAVKAIRDYVEGRLVSG